jgi:hypothetical protein
MEHIKLFEDFIEINKSGNEVNEGVTDILNKAKSGGATISLLASLLASPDVTSADKKIISQKYDIAKKKMVEEITGTGICISDGEEQSKTIALSNAIAGIVNCLPTGYVITYVIVDQTTIKLENGKFQTTVVIKTSEDGIKLTPGEIQKHKNIAARDAAKMKRETNVEKHKKEVEERSKRLGFATVEEYYKWQEERSKGPDQPQDGLEDPKFNSGKRCGIAKAGDRANRSDWRKK